MSYDNKMADDEIRTSHTHTHTHTQSHTHSAIQVSANTLLDRVWTFAVEETNMNNNKIMVICTEVGLSISFFCTCLKVVWVVAVYSFFCACYQVLWDCVEYFLSSYCLEVEDYPSDDGSKDYSNH